MAHISHATCTVLSQALGLGRVCLLVGARLSGLTFEARRVSPSLIAGGVQEIDFGRCPEWEQLRIAIEQQIGTTLRSDGGDLAVALSDTSMVRLLLFTNSHRASDDCIDRLLRSLVGAVPPLTSAGCQILIEGSADPDVVIGRALAGITSQSPFVRYADDNQRWRRVLLMQEICEHAGRSDVSIAFELADMCGSDIGLGRELLERLPAGRIAHSSISAAENYVCLRGARGNEIRQAIEGIPTNLTHSIASGEGILGDPPEVETSTELRHLFLSGLVDYDPSGRYVVRSPMTAGCILPTPPGTVRPLSYSDSVVYRCSSVLPCLATVELALRRALWSFDVLQLAKEVRFETAEQLEKKLVGALLTSELVSKDSASQLRTTVRETLDDQRTLYGQLQSRAGRAELTAALALQLATFRDLAMLATRAGLLSPEAERILNRLIIWRNDVAHFRSIEHEALAALLVESEQVVRLIAGAARTKDKERSA